jgi:hypothetical protein
MKLMPVAIPSTSWPPTRTDPALGRARPETSDRVVDLPHPVGPTIAQNCPGSMSKSTSLIAVSREPVGETNRFVTPVSSIFAGGAGGAGLRGFPPLAVCAPARRARALTVVIALLAGRTIHGASLTPGHEGKVLSGPGQGLCQLLALSCISDPFARFAHASEA